MTSRSLAESTTHGHGEHNYPRPSTATVRSAHDLEKTLDVPPPQDSALANGEGRRTGTGPIVVDWDGPTDPTNPRNWSARRKWSAAVVVSLFTFVSPLSSSMVAPASAQLAQDLGITSHAEIALSISIFILGYAFGPLMLGPLSEIYGRSRVLQLSNVFFLVWNLACGFAQNKAELITFRFLSGFGGSAPLAVGGAVLGDLFAPEQRGQAIAIYSLAPLLGPVVGPVAGAWIAEKSTWRWVFWAITIFDACIQLLGIFALQETYAPVLLDRKAAGVRKSLELSPDAEKGSPLEVKTAFEGADRTWQSVVKKALLRPFALTYHEPIIQLLGAYMAFIYGTLYLFLTTIPSIFGPDGIYHQRTGIAGLHYIALGVGLSCASQANARVMDRIYAHLSRTRGKDGMGRPEFRLPSMLPGTLLLPIGILITGWTVEAKTHWIGPDIGICLTGAGMILTFQSIQTYVIDAFALHAASALAAVSVLRSLAGFGFPLFGPAMFKALGYGWGDTLLAGIAILIGCPAPVLLWYYGERIRKASRHAKS